MLREKKAVDVSSGLLIRDSSFVIIDTELTGLNEKNDSIISIGAIRMKGGKIELSDSFYRLVNPHRHFEPKSVVIHSITPSEVIEEPQIDIVLSEFLEFCGTDIVVGYCLDIDLHFINKEMNRLYGISFTQALVDIYYLYEWLRKRGSARKTDQQSLPDIQSGQLYDLAKAYGIIINGAHNAMIDAYITAQIFQRFLSLLGQKGIETVGDLMKIGHPDRGGDTFSKALEKSSY
jgi:DNA polymerase-3 subunit epsilon